MAFLLYRWTIRITIEVQANNHQGKYSKLTNTPYKQTAYTLRGDRNELSYVEEPASPPKRVTTTSTKKTTITTTTTTTTSPRPIPTQKSTVPTRYYKNNLASSLIHKNYLLCPITSLRISFL